MNKHANIDRWHEMMKHNDMSKLTDILAENAVFHSPVVHTPQKGRAKVALYLTSANHVFADSGFEYVREIVDQDNVMLEFRCEIDGIQINGVDIIHWNQDGLIDDFRVMVRPLKAMNLLWKKMGDMLEAQQ
ncbi:nuclear transport factor 2 family protein [Alphaproteobacteria bacterium]|jgi:hypothetical protein|nr:nuclear transport factor 2 family protein [Alphaproteobacteria bacterium]